MVSAFFLAAPIPSLSPRRTLATAAYRSGLTARHRQGIHISCRSCKISCKICALKSRWQEAAPQKKRASLRRKAIATAVPSHKWDRTTSRCVELSTVAFIVLLMPQVVKNYISMTTGHAEALMVLSWVVRYTDRGRPVTACCVLLSTRLFLLQGYLTSLFGNVLLLGCFVDKQEGGATAVQAIGAAANYVMLAQVQIYGYSKFSQDIHSDTVASTQAQSTPPLACPCLDSTPQTLFGELQIWLAGLMPSVAFVPLTALMTSAAVVNACKFCGAMNSGLGKNLWRGWQDFLGLLGIAMLPQVQPLLHVYYTTATFLACCSDSKDECVQ